MDTFRVELTFSGEHNVDPDKKHGETVNFGAAGDTSADFVIKRFVLGMRAVLAEYKLTSLRGAVLIHSDEVRDDLLTGLRMIIEPLVLEPAVVVDPAPYVALTVEKPENESKTEETTTEQ
jgi:hypothetical protein